MSKDITKQVLDIDSLLPPPTDRPYPNLQPRLPHPLIPLRPLPQNLPLNLPRRTLRHRIDKHHTARQKLISRNLLPNPFLNLFCFRRPTFLKLYISARLFLPIEGIRYAYDADVCDCGMGEEDGFEFGGGDLEAGDFDEFLGLC